MVLVPFLTVVVKFQPVVKASHSCIFLYPSIFLISSFPNLPARRSRKCQINTVFPAISIPLLRASVHTIVRYHCLLASPALPCPLQSKRRNQPPFLGPTHVPRKHQNSSPTRPSPSGGGERPHTDCATVSLPRVTVKCRPRNGQANDTNTWRPYKQPREKSRSWLTA